MLLHYYIHLFTLYSHEPLLILKAAKIEGARPILELVPKYQQSNSKFYNCEKKSQIRPIPRKSCDEKKTEITPQKPKIDKKKKKQIWIISHICQVVNDKIVPLIVKNYPRRPRGINDSFGQMDNSTCNNHMPQLEMNG